MIFKSVVSVAALTLNLHSFASCHVNIIAPQELSHIATKVIISKGYIPIKKPTKKVITIKSSVEHERSSETESETWIFTSIEFAGFRSAPLYLEDVDVVENTSVDEDITLNGKKVFLKRLLRHLPVCQKDLK